MTTRARRGFSLAELLMAVFILGIGVIAIAALFPAGIAQQRQSTDDILGPVVADNALSVLRTKLRPEYFGYGATTMHGDFPWSRPAFFRSPTSISGLGGVNVNVTAGSVSIFDDTLANTTDGEIPWNIALFGAPPTYDGPPFIITQEERYYPMASQGGAQIKPQYVWDFMVRRFQGKLFVAIFVYRVTIPGGDGVYWHVPVPAGSDNPPLPIWIDLEDSGGEVWRKPWSADGDGAAGIQPATIIPNTTYEDYDPLDHAQCWQAPSQWILDQNNTVHRVLSGRRNAGDGPVELARPVPVMPVLRGYTFNDQGGVNPVTNAVTNIFYIPTEVRLDTNGDGTPDQLPATLTPVHVAVKEL